MKVTPNYGNKNRELSFREPEILDFKLDQGPGRLRGKLPPARSGRSAVDGLLVIWSIFSKFKWRTHRATEKRIRALSLQEPEILIDFNLSISRPPTVYQNHDKLFRTVFFLSDIGLIIWWTYFCCSNKISYLLSIIFISETGKNVCWTIRSIWISGICSSGMPQFFCFGTSDTATACYHSWAQLT